MTTLKVTVDLDCGRCSAKIRKVLCCIQERGKFVIEKIVYTDKDGTVLVTGPFDAEKLSCKLRCKAGNVIKKIEVVTPKKEDEKKKEEEKKPTLVCGYPVWPCGCGTPCCQGHSKPAPPPAPTCQCPAWSSCHCHFKPPPPPPAPAPACQCPAWSTCHCHSYPPYQQQPMPMQQCTPMVFCDESPSYGACAVM